MEVKMAPHRATRLAVTYRNQKRVIRGSGPIKMRDLYVKLRFMEDFMHQSIPAAPIPLPPG